MKRNHKYTSYCVIESFPFAGDTLEVDILDIRLINAEILRYLWVLNSNVIPIIWLKSCSTRISVILEDNR